MKGIVHEELHDENILITKNLEVKIIDLEEITELDSLESGLQLEKLDDVIKKVCVSRQGRRKQSQRCNHQYYG